MNLQKNIEKYVVYSFEGLLNRIAITAFMLIALSGIPASADDHLPCSKNGTNIFYINGMFNSDFGAYRSLTRIEDIYKQESAKKSIDSASKLSFDNVYQRSLYKLNSENTPFPDEVGAMSDLIQVAGQYIQDQIEFGERDDATFWQAMGSHFFKAGAVGAQFYPKVGKALLAINALDKSYQGFFVEEFGDTVEEEDLRKMISRVKTRLVDEQRKLIIVSHSQGNFYANKLWNRLIRDGQIDENFENYWGNLQLATPTSYVAAKHGTHITAHQDKYMNSFFVLGNLAPNIYFDSNYVRVDEKGHNFSLFVSSSVKGSAFADQSIQEPMESIFRSRMTDIAKSLAPNCGCDEEDYPLAVHENGGGLIGQFAEVSPLARVNSGATVCGESIVSNYVQLDAGTVVKDSELVAPFSTLDPDEITFELEGELPHHLVLENIEVKDSTIKGFVVSRSRSDQLKTKVLNESLIDSQELDDEALLTSNRYQEGIINYVSLGANLELNNSEVMGSVWLNGHDEFTPVIANSVIHNLVHYGEENLHLSPELTVGGHHIESSHIIKTEVGNFEVQGSGTVGEENYIKNASITDSYLVGAFKIDHLVLSNSSLHGALEARGTNRIEEANIDVSNGWESEVSKIYNVKMLSSPFYQNNLDNAGKCNFIRGLVDLDSLNVECSKILGTVAINRGELYFSYISNGIHDNIDMNLSLVESSKELQTSNLTARDYSFLNLNEIHYFPNEITVSRSEIGGKVNLEEGHEFDRVILHGYDGEINLSSQSSLNHVFISGAVNVENGVSLEHSRVYGDANRPTVIMSDAVVSESYVRDSVLEDFAKVENGSWISQSELGPNSTVNASGVSNLSQLRSLASVSDGGGVSRSIVESNVHVGRSYISGVRLSSSVFEKECRDSSNTYTTDFDCDELSSDLEYPLVQNLEERFMLDMWRQLNIGIAPPAE